MKISIVGSGWVGTAVGKGLTELGNEVIFHDFVDKDLPYGEYGLWNWEFTSFRRRLNDF